MISTFCYWLFSILGSVVHVKEFQENYVLCKHKLIIKKIRLKLCSNECSTLSIGFSRLLLMCCTSIEISFCLDCLLAMKVVILLLFVFDSRSSCSFTLNFSTSCTSSRRLSWLKTSMSYLRSCELSDQKAGRSRTGFWSSVKHLQMMKSMLLHNKARQIVFPSASYWSTGTRPQRNLHRRPAAATSSSCRAAISAESFLAYWSVTGCFSVQAPSANKKLSWLLSTWWPRFNKLKYQIVMFWSPCPLGDPSPPIVYTNLLGHGNHFSDACNRLFKNSSATISTKPFRGLQKPSIVYISNNWQRLQFSNILSESCLTAAVTSLSIGCQEWAPAIWFDCGQVQRWMSSYIDFLQISRFSTRPSSSVPHWCYCYWNCWLSLIEFQE